jgi:hypothetical protein
MRMASRYRDRRRLRAAVGLGAALLAGIAFSPRKGAAVALAQAPGSYAGNYGDSQSIPLDELLNGNIPLTGSVRTRGILEAGPRVRGSIRQYSLSMPTDRRVLTTRSRLPITPGMVIRDSFDFDADRLNMREIEVVGTFQPGMGSDSGVSGGGFWFWAYSEAELDNGEKGRPSPTGLLAIEDLVGRPARLAKETVRVRGQFRGKNLFGDLALAGAPADGWVIKDGDSAVWVAGRRPKGKGWSLDSESRSDTARWLEVVGKIETKDGVTFLRADQVALVPAPKPGDADSQ